LHVYFKEYFISADIDEFLSCIQEIDVPAYNYEIVKRSINISLDKDDKERELVSKMLSAGYPNILSTSCISKGFERLFEISDEIEKDVPQAINMIGDFVARCVADEVLNPSFLIDPIICNLGGAIIDHAKRMLSRDHAGARLEKIWGPGDGRPVEELKIAVDSILQEYILARDIEEAERCIKQLSATHFHYEIVKRAIVIVLDKSEFDHAQIFSLLLYLFERGLFSELQIELGFQKVLSIIDDLILDTPKAATIVRKFIDLSVEKKMLSAEFQKKL
jgi:programmed cell death protein 4